MKAVNANLPLNWERYDAIIFDCDGTLVDSEPAHEEVFVRIIETLGHDVVTAREILAGHFGLTFTAQMEIYAAELGIVLPENLTGIYIDQFKRVPAECCLPIPGAEEMVLSVLRSGRKTGVGSNGEHENVLHALRLGGLLDHFGGHVYSAEMVEKGKPAPDLYLHVAERLGAAPGRCLVFEDSVNGAKAGIAAGMDVIGIVGAFPSGAVRSERARQLTQAGVFQVYDDMRDVMRAFGLSAVKEFDPSTETRTCAAE